MASRAVNTEGDVELGERRILDDTEAPETVLPVSPAEKAQNEFRRSLQRIFSEARWVDNVMDDVKYWDTGM